MKPGKFNLPTIWRGCDWLPVVFIWKDQNGNPIDLTGKTPFVQTSGGLNLNPGIFDATNGVTLLSLPRSFTQNFPVGDQTWDWIWWENFPNGVKYPPFLFGNVSIKEPRTENFS